MTKQPHSLRHLDDAIRRLGNGSMGEYVKLRTLMANAIVAQMLPDGVIKGGSAIKMRFGNANTRFTTDLDTATSTDLEAYASEIALRLKAGWEGFSGIIVSKDPAHPEGVPQEYVMQPFDVKLSYRGKPWCTVPLEVGHNEIGDADDADWIELKDAARAFSEMGFPELEKVPLMSLPHQIAQKIHAVSGGGDRARDLIDLQLIFASTNVELTEVKNVCIRLFHYRDKQSWPPIVTKGENWDLLYASQSEIFSVKPGVDEAIDWVNELIVRIDKAQLVPVS